MTQEEKINVDIIKKIMFEKKTSLPSFMSQNWRTVRSEAEKVKDLLKNISTNDITELNDLIYTGAKLVCEKIGFPLKTTNRKSKPEWEHRIESQIKSIRQQTRILKLNIKNVSGETEKVTSYTRKHGRD